MKKLISILIVALFATTLNAQDTVFFDVSNQMVVNDTNINNYTQDSSKVDTLYAYNSGVQNMWVIVTLYSETIPTTYNSYKVSFSLTHIQGAYNFTIDTNSTTITSGNNMSLFNVVKDSLILKSGDVLDFNISNTVFAGRYQVDVDIIHTVDTIFVSSITTGINDNSFGKESLSFTIYPNPTTDYLNVSNDVSNATFSVFNINGSMVKQGNLNNNRIDVTSLTRGNYILMLNKDGKTLTKQFIKQ